MRTAVRGGTIVTEHSTFRGSVVVGEDGRIEALLADGVEPKADEVIDACGLLILPGAVDAHSHLNDPGYTDSEDFYTGTSGAAAGGVTTVLEHPLTLPLPDDLDVFEDKKAIAQSKAVVDFGLWGALTPDNVSLRGKKAAELEKMLQAGALAFKAFMTFTWEIPRLDDGLLLTAFERLAGSGVPVGVHCENAEIVRYLEEHYKSLGREDPIVHAEARPELAEVEAVGKVLELARGTGAQVHLVHLSVPEAVDLVAEARSRWGLNATAETCHHYLTLTSDALTALGPYAKCNPPLRSARCVEGMWDRLRLGLVDNIGSDHGPFTREEKEKESFWDVPAGLTGIQVMVPLVITEARRRGVPLEAVVRLCSSNPARIFHVYPRKGTIAPGSDGDLVLVDTRSEWPVTAKELYSKEKWTPHEGWTLTARVKRTLVRGRTVYEDTPEGGRIVAEAGSGRFVKPVR